MKKNLTIYFLFFCFAISHHLAKAQEQIPENPLPKYPWMLTLKWSSYKTDNFYNIVSVEGLVKEDYNRISLIDRWGTGSEVWITSAEVQVNRLDRKSQKQLMDYFEIEGDNLESLAYAIEQCGSAGDSVLFKNIEIEVEGKPYQVSGYYAFHFK